VSRGNASTVNDVASPITPQSVLGALEALNDARSFDYLEVAFAELTNCDAEAHESIDDLTVERITTVLLGNVSVDALLSAYAKRVIDESEHRPLAEAFIVNVITRAMARNSYEVLSALVYLRKNVTPFATRVLLNFVGAYATASAMHDLLSYNVTSELTKEEFDVLFTANAELNRERHQPTRESYLRALVLRALGAGDAQELALTLSRDWHGNVQSLIDTSLELNLVAATA
jgi:hypothetical protein